MGERPEQPAAAEDELARHLADAADKASLALRALGRGGHNDAATWTTGVMASLDDAERHPTGDEGPLYTAHHHLRRLAEAATGALNHVAEAKQAREDVRAAHRGQAAILSADARLHLRAARTALDAHTRATENLVDQGGPR